MGGFDLCRSWLTFPVCAHNFKVLPKLWKYVKFCQIYGVMPNFAKNIEICEVLGLRFRVTWVSPPKLGFFLGFEVTYMYDLGIMGIMPVASGC